MRARLALCTAIGCLLADVAIAAKKKPKKERPEETQVLELPKDPPQAVVAETDRLVFHVSPLSSKGLLSQQIRDGIKALWSASKGSQIVKIRAFVAGSGDMRRVPSVVSEMFTDKRQAIPAVSVIQVGGLQMDGAQVVLESIASNKKVVNKNGIAFVSGQVAKTSDAISPLKSALGDMEPRAITCFLNTLEEAGKVRGQVVGAYPAAVVNVVQVRRDTMGDFVECEAVAAPVAPPQSVDFRKPAEGRYSEAVILSPGKVVFLVPRIERKGISAGTWVSHKFNHRVPDDKVLLRLFTTGGKADVLGEIREKLGIAADPIFIREHNWPQSMPQYNVGHTQIVKVIEEMIKDLAGLHVVGNAYYGIGIPDCIKMARQVAARIAGP